MKTWIGDVQLVINGGWLAGTIPRLNTTASFETHAFTSLGTNLGIVVAVESILLPYSPKLTWAEPLLRRY